MDNRVYTKLFKALCYIGAVTIVVVFTALVFSLGVRRGRRYQPQTDKHIPDTIYRTRVVTLSTPPVIFTRLGELMYIPVTDTLMKHDTLFVEVQREIKTYGDSTFKAVVSGYEPSLDFIEFYNKEKIVKLPVPKWSFGVSGGVGLHYGLTHSQFDIGPGIMFSVNYRW